MSVLAVEQGKDTCIKKFRVPLKSAGCSGLLFTQRRWQAQESILCLPPIRANLGRDPGSKVLIEDQLLCVLPRLWVVEEEACVTRRAWAIASSSLVPLC